MNIQKKIFNILNKDMKYIDDVILPYDKNNKLIEYYKEPSEIYVRLNNLKLFLFNNNILNNPNDNLTIKIIIDISDGTIYKNLKNEEKIKFVKSDFIYLIIY